MGSRNRKITDFLKNGKIIAGMVVCVLLIGGYVYFSNSNSNEKSPSVMGVDTSSENLAAPLAEKDLDYTFSFTASDAQGYAAGNVNFLITKAEKTKEVLVQGRPANAKGEKAFLVLNIEIENADTQDRYIAPVDYLRLVGEDGKLFAADIHSEVVKVQPISTKITRVGFVINESENYFNFQIGELNADKQNIEVTF